MTILALTLLVSMASASPQWSPPPQGYNRQPWANTRPWQQPNQQPRQQQPWQTLPQPLPQTGGQRMSMEPQDVGMEVPKYGSVGDDLSNMKNVEVLPQQQPLQNQVTFVSLA